MCMCGYIYMYSGTTTRSLPCGNNRMCYVTSLLLILQSHFRLFRLVQTLIFANKLRNPMDFDVLDPMVQSEFSIELSTIQSGSHFFMHKFQQKSLGRSNHIQTSPISNERLPQIKIDVLKLTTLSKFLSKTQFSRILIGSTMNQFRWTNLQSMI